MKKKISVLVVGLFLLGLGFAQTRAPDCAECKNSGNYFWYAWNVTTGYCVYQGWYCGPTVDCDAGSDPCQVWYCDTNVTGCQFINLTK